MNYTYQDARDESGIPARDGNQLPGRPRHDLYHRTEYRRDEGRLFYELSFVAENFLDQANFLVVNARAIHTLGVEADLAALGRRFGERRARARAAGRDARGPELHRQPGRGRRRLSAAGARRLRHACAGRGRAGDAWLSAPARVAVAAARRSSPSCSSGGVEDRGTGETPPPLEGTSAFVVTTDFQTGSFAVFPVLQPDAVARNVERIHSDAVARVHDGLVYVVNRLGGDNVQAIDPAAGYATRWQCSVENGSNPHDIAFAAPDKAYVTRYERATLLIVDPTTGADCARLRARHRSTSRRSPTRDGLPEMDQAVVIGGRLFVTLQRLDRRNFFRPTDRSLIAVIDVATDAVVGSITLTGTNPVRRVGRSRARSGDRHDPAHRGRRVRRASTTAASSASIRRRSPPRASS